MDSTHTEMNQLLTFCVSGEQYGLPVLRVREIIEYSTITRLPRSPRAIRGAVNLRGAVIPVIDLAACFGVEPGPVTRRSCIIMTETEWTGQNGTVGVLADAVDQVLDLPEGTMLEPPRIGANTRPDLVQGLREHDGKFVLVLDLERVLAGIDAPESEEAEVAEETAAVA